MYLVCCAQVDDALGRKTGLDLLKQNMRGRNAMSVLERRHEEKMMMGEIRKGR